MTVAISATITGANIAIQRTVLLSQIGRALKSSPAATSAAPAAAGVQIICLLALNDSGAPMFHKNHAAAFAALGIPAFACTPDLFPDLMAAAMQRQDINHWVAQQGITASRAKESP